jgi:septum formation protein
VVNKIILASQSPRRKQLLSEMGVEFESIPSAYDEKLDESRDASEVAKELALGKALAVAHQYPTAYVIGSDTIVAKDGRQMEKPRDIDNAKEMLIALSSGESSVCTGIAVVNISLGIEIVDVDTTHVFFKPDSKEVAALRDIYLQSMDWKDKAGGYGIQSGAGPLIERIVGDYDTVVGLPTRLLAVILAGIGITATAASTEPLAFLLG